MIAQSGLNSRIVVFMRLNQQQMFLCGFDLSFPFIQGGNAGQDIDAGGDITFNQQSGYFFCRVFFRASAEDDQMVSRHITSH
jgi:hypothetical protein